ncbi:thioredoxin reductase [Bordetella genomosp. 10]|uniref:Thioredoxin reductase n=1 Tax=Bordetella genomosp. 10 TaxID=1416804 RepID=A0A261SM64_9BORD|nr:cytochrome b/b6 domain-containing protein [Bordetella genomosp. 10]OZI38506.1 thioredoxin reductase [Bordetella genomosp. 10]
MHASSSPRPPARARVHTLPVRLTHWVNVYAMGCMFMSGWGIYNASPIFPFTFPEWATLGGWLGAATIWHFAVMWLLVGNGLLYLLTGALDGHLRRDLFSVRAADVRRDVAAALRLRLGHRAGHYNAVQKAMYLGVLLLGLLLVLSGLAIWKPVQLQALTTLFGGFAAARVVHFLAMAGVALFVIVHVLMVLLVPRTLPPMITGRAPLHRAPLATPRGGHDA